jgi:1-deoxy-D-xylulose-5-phosphate reductoisomerase
MNISVLGSTGSIGVQTLEVAARLGIGIRALTAGRNVKFLAEQVRQTGAEFAGIADVGGYNALKLALADTSVKISAGEAAIAELAALKTDRVVNAIVGISGLIPTEAAITAGNSVALANKETLVAGGEFIMPLARSHGVDIIPVDSEHSAIFQCQQTSNGGGKVNKIILTCSGGAFYGRTDLEDITPDEIYNPNWVMGKKVTLDSATLANKGLEFIEAMRLFDVTPDQIEVVIHRESILHSAVEFADGAVIAQLGLPDMRLPIQYALTYPERLDSPAKRLSLTETGSLTFAKPDMTTFSALPGFIKAARMGGYYPAVVNAVNDTAGALFLEGKLTFTGIGELINEALDLPYKKANTIKEILSANELGKAFVTERASI